MSIENALFKQIQQSEQTKRVFRILGPLVLSLLLNGCTEVTVDSLCKTHECTAYTTQTDLNFIADSVNCWNMFTPDATGVIPAGTTIQIYQQDTHGSLLKFIMKSEGDKFVKGWIDKSNKNDQIPQKSSVDPFCHPYP